MTNETKKVIQIWGTPNGEINNYEILQRESVKATCLQREEEFDSWNCDIEFNFDETINVGWAYTNDDHDEYELLFEYSEELEAKIGELTLMKEVEELVGLKK
jgi:hypothetical protein